jgi:hypothetical protein
MRILVAALNSQTGDLAGNLARHRAVLEQARVQGCRLAVFPEFSLTGSVDPRRNPERALPVDAAPVRACWRRPGGRAWPRCSASPSGPDPPSTSPGCTATTAASASRWPWPPRPGRPRTRTSQDWRRSSPRTGGWPGCPTGTRGAWSWRSPSTSPSTRSVRPSAACWSTRPAGRCWPATTSRSAPGSGGAGGARRSCAPRGPWSPRDLPGLLERIARGDLPDPDEDLGV